MPAPLTQAQTVLEIATRGTGFVDITAEVDRWLAGSGITTGLATLFLQHTSAGLTVQENADPDVLRDLTTHLERLAPRDPGLYRHTLEGPDDMPAHIRSSLTGVSLTIPVGGGRLLLGTWQAVYVCEHRASPHRRRVVVHVTGA
ncbi:secondary thiamine-phosphate synthase enzyme YjbQ [Caenispirillum bisanense]|uniref:secondary thiamine-phosphate synthase enzyme YjbQ n=1 Tax=Caenispirillum bisanense TaxID=414052 RepID=UPI0031D244C5